MNDTLVEKARNEEVVIVPYDPAWVQAAAAERDRLLALFPGRFVAIEHFGSTAVPGLAAKPIVDLLGGVESLEAMDALLGPLCENGYHTNAALNATLRAQRWLMRQQDGRRTHHLILVLHGSDDWHMRIDFREALRRDPALRAEYEAKKIAMARDFGHDRKAYVAAKNEYLAKGWLARR
jgi:GrpB-like predicted nucleotidyltransferase (UPF0157 family)